MVTLEKFPVLVALPIVVIASFIEAVVLSRFQAYDWKAMGVSLCNLALRYVVTVLLPLSVAAPVFQLAWEHRLATVPLDSWLAIALLFIGQEFCYYWFHRASHRVRWFWVSHSVHHSPNQLNLAAAYRISAFGRLAGNTLFYVPLVWLGFPTKVVLVMLTLNLLYQFWIHATWIPKLGWLEYVLNTPSAHRVHHAANLEYLDGNYGGVLIIFDRLFGTYIPERDDLPCRYGWVRPQTSYNPLRVEFGPWIALLKDLWQARSPKAMLGYLVMPPGWRHDGPGETTEELRGRARAVPPAVPAAGPFLAPADGGKAG
jgi:sterol desaturase/sphingolipid hydroxylase (fatty acid hydroxylase superfamily)